MKTVPGFIRSEDVGCYIRRIGNHSEFPDTAQGKQRWVQEKHRAK